MCFRNLLADCKAKPSALAGALRGEEWLKNMRHIRFGDSMPAVPDAELNFAFFCIMLCAYSNLARSITDCLIGVDDQVQHQLNQLCLIALYAFFRAGKLMADVNFMRYSRLGDGQHFIDQFIRREIALLCA